MRHVAALSPYINSSGNTYVTGSFNGTATFGNIALTSTGNEDAFITKLDSSGKFLWAKKVGGISVEANVTLQPIYRECCKI